VPHAFEVESESARALVVVTPGGFKRKFEEGGVAAAESAEPPEQAYDPEAAIAISQRFGFEVVGPQLAQLVAAGARFPLAATSRDLRWVHLTPHPLPRDDRFRCRRGTALVHRLAPKRTMDARHGEPHPEGRPPRVGHDLEPAGDPACHEQADRPRPTGALELGVIAAMPSVSGCVRSTRFTGAA